MVMHLSKSETRKKLSGFVERMNVLRGRSSPLLFKKPEARALRSLPGCASVASTAGLGPRAPSPQSPCHNCRPVGQHHQLEGGSQVKGYPGESCLGQSWEAWSVHEGARVQSCLCQCSEQTRLLVTVADSCMSIFCCTAASSQVGALVGRRPAGS